MEATAASRGNHDDPLPHLGQHHLRWVDSSYGCGPDRRGGEMTRIILEAAACLSFFGLIIRVVTL